MISTLEPDVRVPAPVRPTPALEVRPEASPAQADPSATAPAAGTRRVSRRTKNTLITFGVAGSVLIGVIGFLLSFDNLTAAGVKWGFGDRASWFAVGVDASILTFLVVDLILVIFDVRFGLPRFLAHAMTGATVFFNATAHGHPLDHPVRSLAHGLMPVFFVAGIEAGRRLLIKQAALERGRAYDPIPVHRWALAPWATYKLWRRMKLWEMRSYVQAISVERDRAIYDVWLKHREELEAGQEKGKVGALDRLPMTMKKFGMSVDEALALPDKMRRAEQERKQKADAAALQLELDQEKSEAEAEKQRLLVQGEIDALRASVKADTGVAQAQAEAATAGARLKATTALTAAQRAADAADRLATDEAAAAESVTVAAAKRKAAEAEREAAEAAREAAEAQLKADTDHAKAEAERAKAAEAQQRAAEAEAAASEASLRAATAREATAQILRRAVEAEDFAGFSQRERRVRTAARMLLAAQAADEPYEITNAEIAAAIGVKSEGTASEHRADALALIGRGYDPTTGYDPDAPSNREG
ncbi:DUF2637 domain-containing protein (plasmid) [Streptomyces virginiae]|uniref:DUF2637 domain-containing protein n=1 Tax=Streptomyces virginiae TaxID=1961 RepID=UPI002F90B88E